MKRYILMLMLIVVVGLGAREAANLSYDQARELAKQGNSDYQAKQSALEAAKWQKNVALSSFLPNLSLTGTLLYMDPAQSVQAGANTIELNNDFRTIGLSLSQPLFTGGKLWQAYKMAEIGVEMAELALKNQELSLMAELETSYLAVLQTMSLLDMAELDYQSAERNLEIALLKKDAGIISNADYLRFESNKASKEVSLLQAQSAYSLSQMKLKNLLGIEYYPVPQEIADQDDAQMQMISGFDTAKTRLLSNLARQRSQQDNIALRLTDSGLELSRRAYEISKGSFLPTVMLTGSRKYEENGIDRWDFNASNQIMLNVSLPLLPQLDNYATMRKSYFDLQQKKSEAETARDGIDTALEAAVLNLVSSAKQVGASKLALSYTEQTYEQLQQRYRMNMISSGELLDVELMLSAARVSYTGSLYNYYKARAALKQLLGMSTMDEYNDLISGSLLLSSQE